MTPEQRDFYYKIVFQKQIKARMKNAFIKKKWSNIATTMKSSYEGVDDLNKELKNVDE